MAYKKQALCGQSASGVDEPLIDPADDCLERDNFAKRIFSLIDSSPIDTHLRVGILGDWGSGKTTAMNFIKKYCCHKGHPVAVFHPWQFHSREDAWKGFVSALDKGLALWKKLPVGNFRRKRAIKDISGKARQIAEIADTKIGKAIGELILSPLENLLEESKANVNKDLKSLLGDKRLYVFIDDLDRAEPEIVYDMLMLLNEIFDITQCVFIIGLDTKTVADILREKLGYMSPKDFIDKIINWPFELPIPSHLDWRVLLEKELSGMSSSIEKEAIISILDILPRNPRKFKHYLRYLESLHKAFLSRFGKDELDWKMLYLAQLLRMEFPEAFRVLMQDEEVIEDVASGRLMDQAKDISHKAFGNKKDEETPAWRIKMQERLAKHENIDGQRFFLIYGALRECSGMVSPERVRNHLLVIEVPELMTWSEYRALKSRLITLDSNSITAEFKKFITKKVKSRDIETIREFLKMLLRDREEVWSRLVDLHLQNEMKSQLEDVNKIMFICNTLLDIDELFIGANPIFDKAIFEEWLEFLSKWAHFVEPKELYSSPRNDEKTLIIKMVKKNLFRSSDMAEWLRKKFRHSDIDGQQRTLINVKKEIDAILEERLVEDLLSRFEKKGGIHDLWPNESFISEKLVLCKDGTSFHKKEVYEKLSVIAKKAEFNIEIQNNFVEALRIFLYYATNHSGWVTPEEAQQLVKKKEFFNIIWSAAVCRSLNRRLVGSFEEYLHKMEDVFKDNNFFKRPAWWVALILQNKG